MPTIPETQWKERERDYRSGLTCAELAEKYSVSADTTRYWVREHGWSTPLNPAQMLDLLWDVELALVNRDWARGDLDAAAKRLRLLTAFERLARTHTRPPKNNGHLSDEDEEAASYPGGYHAELERRLDRIIASSRANESEGGADVGPDGGGA